MSAKDDIIQYLLENNLPDPGSTGYERVICGLADLRERLLEECVSSGLLEAVANARAEWDRGQARYHETLAQLSEKHGQNEVMAATRVLRERARNK
jgi:hypothetical protein